MIKNFYDEQDIRLFQGDCLQIIDFLIENNIKVDAIITDPPYGTTACKWDSVIPFDDMWDRLKKIRKDTTPIILFNSEPFGSFLRCSNIKEYKYDWIWEKNFSGGFATAKKMPMKYHENISVFYKKQCLYNPQFQEYADSVKKRFKDGENVNVTKQQQNNTNQIHNGFGSAEHQIHISRGKYPQSVQFFKGVPNCNGTRVHPTQKPVELIEYLIKTYTNEWDLVLDFTMGSGTTGVACKKLNRKFIGIELDENYFNIAINRIKEVENDTTNISDN